MVSMVFHGFHGFPMVSYGFPMVFPWFSTAVARPRQVLRQRRFALRDLFDLTRPPASSEVGEVGSLGGLHAMEIQAGERLGEINHGKTMGKA